MVNCVLLCIYESFSGWLFIQYVCTIHIIIATLNNHRVYVKHKSNHGHVRYPRIRNKKSAGAPAALHSPPSERCLQESNWNRDFVGVTMGIWWDLWWKKVGVYKMGMSRGLRITRVSWEEWEYILTNNLLQFPPWIAVEQPRSDLGAPKKKTHDRSQVGSFSHVYLEHMTGWWFQPLWKIFVTGKDYPICYGKYIMTYECVYITYEKIWRDVSQPFLCPSALETLP